MFIIAPQRLLLLIVIIVQSFPTKTRVHPSTSPDEVCQRRVRADAGLLLNIVGLIQDMSYMGSLRI